MDNIIENYIENHKNNNQSNELDYRIKLSNNLANYLIWILGKLTVCRIKMSIKHAIFISIEKYILIKNNR